MRTEQIEGMDRVVITRAMMDPRRGYRVKCWVPRQFDDKTGKPVPRTGMYRWFASVDAREHVARGTAFLAVNSVGAEVDFDPKTNAPIGKPEEAMPQKSNYDLEAYSMGELRMIAQEAGVAFHGIGRERLIERIRACGYRPMWDPASVARAESVHGRPAESDDQNGDDEGPESSEGD